MATITNQATLTYSGGVANSNIAVGELLEVLSASKTAVRDTYAQGEDVTYVVSLVNSGTADLTAVTVTDDLGGYTFGAGTVYPLAYVDGTMRYYINGVLQAAPTVTAGPPLTVTGLTVPAGGNATLVYEAAVTRFAPPAAESSVTNTVTVAGTGITTPVTAAEAITARTGPALSILKSLSPNPVTENGRLTYTFTIQNTGNAPVTADDAAVITDTFEPVLRDLTVIFNGAAWAAPANYTYDAAAGAFSTVAGQITVPAATYAQDAATGAWTVTPGVSTLAVTGTV